MKSELHPGERLVKEGRANFQRGLETVGGHLALTDHRLVFEPHRVNFQREVAEIAVAEIASSEAVLDEISRRAPRGSQLDPGTNPQRL